jgi:hypothetical protein
VGDEYTDQCRVSADGVADGSGAAPASPRAAPPYGAGQSRCVSGVPGVARSPGATL